ncbi:MAG TPA: hypothetical protein VKB22_03040 [Gemmatimonadales bacterium]|nr:hypothetical protein [Gemmatimonadales bacterium]
MFRAFGSQAASAGLLAIALLFACGRKDAQPDVSADTASSEESAAQDTSASAAPAAQPSGNPTAAPLTPADIDRWTKGMEGELRAVREAGAKLKSARTSDDTLNAMMGVQEMATVEAGAKAAGVDPERYKFIRSNLSAVVGYLTPSLGGIDTTSLPQAQRDELRKGNETQIQRMQQEVPAEVVEAIKPRAVELRKKDMELVAARLKGAGM